MEDHSKLFFGCVGVIALLVLSTMYGGFVLSVLWGWFMVKTFALPALSIAQAIGVALVIRLITNEYPDRKTDKDAIGVAVVNAFMLPSVFLLMGWIMTLFI